jgi:Tfp pilus assembly protein PilF
MHIAKNYLALGKPIRAKKLLKEILRADPENEEASHLLRLCV